MSLLKISSPYDCETRDNLSSRMIKRIVKACVTLKLLKLTFSLIV